MAYGNASHRGSSTGKGHNQEKKAALSEVKQPTLTSLPISMAVLEAGGEIE